ncbi:Mth938-like domain-containing protein [Oceanicella sp. SM1341]|uniref:Mth938-like domain-containing protein n=1 Tax=Oceanicella sp. SM1341 TaxID=1548889 RepID=UPI000E4F0047|nr:Mth938-like domain-containing protein [Oceanicella sp. SM1341]
MHLNEIRFDGQRPVDGYGPGFFRVGGTVMSGAILLLPEASLAWGGPEDVEPIAAALEEIDVVLFGMGPDIATIPEATRTRLDEAGIGVEVMSTPSACRTYNVLLAEGRRVGLALLPV